MEIQTERIVYKYNPWYENATFCPIFIVPTQYMNDMRIYGKNVDKYRYENTTYRYVYRYDHDTDIFVWRYKPNVSFINMIHGMKMRHFVAFLLYPGDI